MWTLAHVSTQLGKYSIERIVCSRDGAIACVCYMNGCLDIRRIPCLTLLSSIRGLGIDAGSVAFTTSGELIFGGNSSCLYLFDATSGDLISAREQSGTPVQSALFSLDGQNLGVLEGFQDEPRVRKCQLINFNEPVPPTSGAQPRSLFADAELENCRGSEWKSPIDLNRASYARFPQPLGYCGLIQPNDNRIEAIAVESLTTSGFIQVLRTSARMSKNISFNTALRGSQIAIATASSRGKYVAIGDARSLAIFEMSSGDILLTVPHANSYSTDPHFTTAESMFAAETAEKGHAEISFWDIQKQTAVSRVMLPVPARTCDFCISPCETFGAAMSQNGVFAWNIRMPTVQHYVALMDSPLGNCGVQCTSMGVILAYHGSHIHSLKYSKRQAAGVALVE